MNDTDKKYACMTASFDRFEEEFADSLIDKGSGYMLDNVTEAYILLKEANMPVASAFLRIGYKHMTDLIVRKMDVEHE